jgi:thioredoxin 1
MVRLLALALIIAVSPVLADDAKKDETSKDAAKSSPIFHKITFKEAVEKAKKEKKVVMVAFCPAWCDHCQKLKSETFSKAEVKKLLKDKLVAFSGDDDKDKTFWSTIAAFPTLVFVDGDGKEVGRLVGFRDASKFVKDVGKFTK